MLTTEIAHDLPVTRRLGIVASEHVVGMHIFKDILVSARDIFGGRSETVQREMSRARAGALADLRREAQKLGANAVVGVSLSYNQIAGNSTMLMVVATGTAVELALPTEMVVRI